MNENERNQFVDDLLEASLARYSNVTPRPGLDGHVLANARAAHARRSWFVWAGWLAAGAAAALIVFGVLSLTHRATNPAPPTTAEVVKPGVGTGLRHVPVTGPPIQQARAPRRPMAQRATQVTSIARAEVRLPVFPSPSPLSAQEHLLLACLKLSSETQEAIFKKGIDTTVEVEIKPLPPLVNDSEAPEGENNN